MGFAQLALPLRLSAMSIEGRTQRIGVGCLQTTFMLHSQEQFVVVADVLIVTAHNQIIIGGLRRSALQHRRTRVGGSKCDSRQASDVRTPPVLEDVLGTGSTRSRIPNPK